MDNEENGILKGYLAKIKPLLEAGILFLGAAIVDILLMPYVLCSLLIVNGRKIVVK